MQKSMDAMRNCVICDKDTKEVIACISNTGECILKKGLDVKFYDGTEPVFTETDHGIFLNENAFVIKL